MKDLSHDNIKVFIGACIEPGNVCLVMQHCGRGSLQVSVQIQILFRPPSRWTSSQNYSRFSRLPISRTTNLELSPSWHHTDSIFFLFQIKTQNLPLYSNSAITGHRVNSPRLWLDVTLDFARVTSVLHYITLHYCGLRKRIKQNVGYILRQTRTMTLRGRRIFWHGRPGAPLPPCPLAPPLFPSRKLSENFSKWKVSGKFPVIFQKYYNSSVMQH